MNIKEQILEEGYIVLRDIFTKDEILECQKEVIQYLKNHRKSDDNKVRLNAGGASITDFINRKELTKTATMKENPKIQEALCDIFSGDDYRFCSHSGIGINRIVGWHKDKLNGIESQYETVNIWEEYNGHKHEIVKVLVYLEDHENDNDGLKLVPRSHLNPNINPSGFIQIRPKVGDVIIFDQRITHRGMDKQVKYPRILVTIGFGKNNIFTDNFEKGTVIRQNRQNNIDTNYDKNITVRCPLCSSKFLKQSSTHLLFNTQLLYCNKCVYTFEKRHMLQSKDTLDQQLNNSETFGTNLKRNIFYIDLLRKIKSKVDVQGVLEIGTPKNYDFLSRIHHNFPELNLYSHDVIENEFPDYINFYKSKDLLLNRKIDILFCIHTLEHIPVYELVDFVEFAKKVATYFIFEIPCCENPTRVMHSSRQPHYSFFTEKSIRKLFGEEIEVYKNNDILLFNNFPQRLY